MTRAKILFLLIYLSTTAFNQEAGTLLIQIHNLETDEGRLRLAIYDKEQGFLGETGAVAGKSIDISSPVRVANAELPNMRFGHYALAVYHDIDDNGKLNTNLLGIPTEPYAFSNDPKVKWRSPRFKEARFEFREHGQTIGVTLQRWKER